MKITPKVLRDRKTVRGEGKRGKGEQQAGERGKEVNAKQ